MGVNNVLFVTFGVPPLPMKYIQTRFNEHVDAILKSTVNSKTDECLLNRKYYFFKFVKFFIKLQLSQ